MAGVRRFAWVVSSSVALLVVASCHAAPRQAPVRMSPVSGTLQQVRGQFEGSWELVSFEAAGEDGRLAAVESAGRLTYDGYGNLEIDGRILDPASDDLETSLDIKGRAVIDTQNQRLWIQSDVDPLDLDAIPEGASMDRFRYYEIGENQLTLSVKDEAGAVTARTVWRRVVEAP